MSRHLVQKSIFAVALAALLAIATGCKTSVTVTSNPPGARAYVGPMSGSLWLVDSQEESSREQYVGETPVTVQSTFVWNEWGHAWAHVEWPDGTKSTTKVRKPREVGPMVPATFEFNEADYKNASANSTSTPAPASVAPSAGLFGLVSVSTATAPTPTPSSPSPSASVPAASSSPATTPSKPAVPASATTAADLIGTWQSDEDKTESLVIHPNFSATWHIGSVENEGNINLTSDNVIQFDYHDRAFNKNNTLSWKIIDSQTISISRFSREEMFHHQ